MKTTIKMGSKGDSVREWQLIIGVLDDGEFGPKTFEATLAWQRAWNQKNPNDLITVDGIVGPKTWERAMKTGTKVIIGAGLTVLASIAAALLSTDENKLRKLVVKAAESQMDNTDPTPYWKDTMGGAGPWPRDWCGAFALWCLHQAGLALGTKWKQSLGFLLVPPNALPTVKIPMPGDIAYFERSQHHAVVKQVNADGTMDLINGNGFNPELANGALSEVAPSRVKITAAKAIYSIKPYIDKKLAA